MPTEFDLGQQYENEICLRLIEADILRESRSTGDVVIVCLGGPSAGGKSQTADLLASPNPQFSVVHMDDYMAGEILPFKAPPHPDHPFLGGISPEVFDLERMHNDILMLADGKTIDKPVFDRASHKRAACSVTFPSNKVILVEGLYALTTGFVEHANFGVYVDSPLHDRLIRKIIRGLEKYHHKDINKIICSYLDIVEPNFRLYEEHLKGNAKYVILNKGITNAEKVGDPSILTCSEGFVLIPKPGNGTVHPGEMLSLFMQEGNPYLIYRRGEKMILTEKISTEAMLSLSRYYDLKPFGAHE